MRREPLLPLPPLAGVLAWLAGSGAAAAAPGAGVLAWLAGSGVAASRAGSDMVARGVHVAGKPELGLAHISFSVLVNFVLVDFVLVNFSEIS